MVYNNGGVYITDEMDWQYAPQILPVLAGAAISIILAAYAWRRRQAEGAMPFACLMLAVTGWSLSYAVELGGRSLPILLLGHQLTYVGMATVPFFWWWFTVQYARRREWSQRSLLFVLLIIPFLTLLFVWTNAWQGLLWQQVGVRQVGSLVVLATQPGWWFWVHVVYSYLLLFGSTAVLIATLFQRASFVYRGQLAVLLAGVLIPWLSNALNALHLSVLDLTPFGFAIGGLLMTWGIFPSRLFEMMPVAQQAIWDKMHDGMMVLDWQHRVVGINPAAEAIVGLAAAEVMGKLATAVLRNGTSQLQQYIDAREVSAEIQLTNNDRSRLYALQVTPFYNRFNQVNGRLLLLHDITEQKQAETALRTQKQLFESLVALAPTTAEQQTLRDGLHNTLVKLVILAEAKGGHLYLPDISVAGTSWIVYQPEDQQLGKSSLLLDQSVIDWVMRQRQLLNLPDIQHDDRWPVLSSTPLSVRSALIVPLVSKGGLVVGVLGLCHARPAHFTQAYEELLLVAAEQMALVIHSALMLHRQQLISERQAITYKLLRAVSGSLEPAEVAFTAVATVAELTGWPAVAILFANPVDERLTMQASVGVLTIDEGVNGRAFRTGATQIYPDPDLTLIWPNQHTTLAVPLRSGRRHVGIFNVEVDRPNGFTAGDITLAESLAEVIAFALENARLFQLITGEQSRLQALIAANRDGIVLVGMDGEILVANQPAVDFLQLPGKGQDWVKRPLLTALNALRREFPRTVRQIIAELRQLQQGSGSAHEDTLEIGSRTLNWRSLPVMAGERAMGRLLVLRDVTEERMLEHMRDDLMHTMVHDLRGPLTSISVSLHLLEAYSQDGMNERTRETLLHAHKSMEMVLGLVNSILDVSRLESGRMALNREPFSFPRLVSNVLEWQLPLIDEKRLKLELNLPDNLPFVFGDEDLLGRVLQNLIGNAIKFTPSGGKIALAAVGETAVSPHNHNSNEHVCVSIHDTGPGISPEIRGRVFQKFVKGDQEGGGSGLGLYFCKMVIESHGEHIWLDEAYSLGTGFYFTLPVKQ